MPVQCGTIIIITKENHELAGVTWKLLRVPQRTIRACGRVVRTIQPRTRRVRRKYRVCFFEDLNKYIAAHIRDNGTGEKTRPPYIQRENG